MDNLEPTTPDLPRVLAALERELADLDRIGAHIAAAHLDAAIQQLRLDQVRGPRRGMSLNFTA